MQLPYMNVDDIDFENNYLQMIIMVVMMLMIVVVVMEVDKENYYVKLLIFELEWMSLLMLMSMNDWPLKMDDDDKIMDDHDHQKDDDFDIN